MIVEAFDLTGRRVPVFVGVIATRSGVQTGMRVGEKTTLIRPDQVVAQPIVNLREALLAKWRGPDVCTNHG
jgi:hypothetical protein